MKNKKNLFKINKAFENKNFRPTVHSKEVDLSHLQLALQIERVKLYSISPSSPLSEFIPLAPVQNSNPMQVLPKPQDFICDFVELPKKEVKLSFMGKFNNFLIEEGLFERAEKNIFLRLMRDVWFLGTVVKHWLKRILKKVK